MEFDVQAQMHTHAVAFRRVSPMPFRINVLWCQRGSPCMPRDKTRDRWGEKMEEDIAGRDIWRGRGDFINFQLNLYSA